MASPAVASIDELNQRFSLLGLEGSKKREASLQRVLDGSDFRIFTVVKDLGYWGWTPSGSYRRLEGVTAKEILNQVDVHRKPNQLSYVAAIKRRLPRTFAKLPPQEQINKYPFAAPIIAGLHVLVKNRGVDLGLPGQPDHRATAVVMLPTGPRARWAREPVSRRARGRPTTTSGS